MFPTSLYREAQARHRHRRELVYQEVARDFVVADPSLAGLRFGEITAECLETWRATWPRTRLDGTPAWNWEALVQRMPTRAAVLPLAIWHDTDLCGLARGYLSRRRLSGRRHVAVLTEIERRPGANPLAGDIVVLAAAVAAAYGQLHGAQVLRLCRPVQPLLGYYRDRLGFEIVYKAANALYCERRI